MNGGTKRRRKASGEGWRGKHKQGDIQASFDGAKLAKHPNSVLSPIKKQGRITPLEQAKKGRKKERPRRTARRDDVSSYEGPGQRGKGGCKNKFQRTRPEERA